MPGGLRSMVTDVAEAFDKARSAWGPSAAHVLSGGAAAGMTADLIADARGGNVRRDKNAIKHEALGALFDGAGGAEIM
eukprot:3774840-Pyramimonas_sp.AAC.1